MASEYKPYMLYDPKIDPNRCKAAVFRDRARASQCLRKPWKDGWCKQHHPDTVAARREAQKRKWQEKWDNDPRVKQAKEAETLRSQRDELARILRQVEWMHFGGYKGPGRIVKAVRQCPYCKGFEPEHKPDCALQAALTRLEADE